MNYSRDDATHYFDGTILSQTLTDTATTQDLPCNFNYKAKEVLISNSEDYECSIVRASLQGVGRGLPLFVPIIQVGQADVNKTIWSITMRGTTNSNANVNVSQTLQWVSPDTTLPTPLSGTTQLISNPYYWANNFQSFCDMFNNATSALYAQIYIGIGNSYTYLPPRLIWDANSKIFKLINSTHADVAGLQIYFNDNLMGMLQGFVYTRNAIGNRVSLTNLQYSPPLTISGNEYTVISQEYSSTDSLWSPVQAIVFCSALIPIVSEITTPAVVLGQGQSIGISQQSLSVLTDISVSLSSASDWKNSIVYSPNEYRMISMTKGYVKDIDIQIYWKATFSGELIPLKMWNQSTANIKIMFRPKK